MLAVLSVIAVALLLYINGDGKANDGTPYSKIVLGSLLNVYGFFQIVLYVSIFFVIIDFIVIQFNYSLF